MIFEHPPTVQWVADLINAEIIGDANDKVLGLNEIHRVQHGDIAFVDHPKYYEKCLRSDASFIIIDQPVEERFGKTLLVCAAPFEAYLTIVRHFRPLELANQTISSFAVIGKTSVIMPGVFIAAHVNIGEGCIIYPNVTIHAYTTIGNNVIIQSGTVIGTDAFYYNSKKTRSVWYKKMESCGGVIIEDDVEIGANTCIDRGVTSNTIIGCGSKIDNLVQIGHDVVIGANCIIAAQVGIAGATTLGNGVNLWGQVGVNKTIHIGDGANVLGQAGVVATIAGNKTYMGTPAEDAGIKRREFVWTKRIPEMWAQLRKMDATDKKA